MRICPIKYVLRAEGKLRSTRQIPTTLEHSPTIRKQPETFCRSQRRCRETKECEKIFIFRRDIGQTRCWVGCEVNVSSVFNIHDDLLKADEKANTVSVVIKSSTGNVVVWHVKDAKAKSIVRNIACKNWKTAVFAILKCESLTDELLNALSKQQSVTKHSGQNTKTKYKSNVFAPRTPLSMLMGNLWAKNISY